MRHLGCTAQGRTGEESKRKKKSSTAFLFRALADEVAELSREVKQLRQRRATDNQSGKDQNKPLERRVGTKTDITKEDKGKILPSEANSTRLAPSKKAKDLPKPPQNRLKCGPQ